MGKIESSIKAVIQWVEQHDYRAYDPGDGEMSFLRYLTFDTHLLRRILTAVVLRSPFHIRPLIGIRPHTSTKGMGYMGWGYVKMYAISGDESYRKRAEHCFNWLMANRSQNDHYCWGNAFSFSTRAGTIPRYTPTIVWSSLIGLAFLEAFEVLHDPSYLQVATSVGAWIKLLPREHTDSGTCLSYVPFRQSSIHNANMLGAGFLARLSTHVPDKDAVDLAREAMRYSCSRQLPDGAWYYGEEPKYHWIDNFHTGYNLDSLRRYVDSTADREFDTNLKLGLRYFVGNFFEEDGRPKYFHNDPGATDIQCASQSIDTLAYFSDIVPSTLPLALKVANFTIDNMQGTDGHFYYRDLRWKKIKIPMFHWGQGTTFKALAHLQSKLAEQASESAAARSTVPAS